MNQLEQNETIEISYREKYTYKTQHSSGLIEKWDVWPHHILGLCHELAMQLHVGGIVDRDGRHAQLIAVIHERAWEFAPASMKVSSLATCFAHGGGWVICQNKVTAVSSDIN